ncbi:hypothetical protein QZM35_22695 [Burkholderia sp. AU45274]|uniref:hypothetical protein n=1 Tax=Burkholderia sp. AU45274 TaxID=3059205 RepID=UPI00264FE0B9|nr:hypothetical protein [Burkholderia sp. AU45274]MDN7489456.1 hypothetical protein [Burkholderia sp. AU45274]MDN7490524.1 hypothetical protein [Burkholderia sp. AU45274]
MTEPILTLEEVEALWEKTPKCIDGTFNFVGFAAAIEAAVLEKVCGDPVGILSVHRFRKIDSMVNWDFEYTGSLPDGSHQLYAITRSKP